MKTDLMRKINSITDRGFSGCFPKLKRYQLPALILGLAGLPLLGLGQSTWTGGTSTDWNTAGNWSSGVPSGADANVNTITPHICTISATLSATPVNIRIGTGGTGRVDQPAGTAFTGSGNWLYLGYSAGNATYNLCDTTASGGAYTGYGLGSGSLYVGGTASPNGDIMLGLDASTTGTLNVNSSGTLAASGLYVSGSGAGKCVVNLDHGTVALSGDCQFGADYWAAGTDGRLNMSGGTLTASTLVFSRGNNGSSVVAGTGVITGGTINALTWLTLGFCGTPASVGTVTNSGGTINVNTTSGGNMEMTTWDSAGALYVQNSGALNLDNSAYIAFGNGGNNAGTATFIQNGGTVTFYSDAGTTVGGTGYLELGRNAGWAQTSGTYVYDLNGGTLTVPQIQLSSTAASGTFNFNGGTLKAAASTTTFLHGLSAANIAAGGAIIDTTNFNVTIAQFLQDGGGSLTKLGTGTLTLSGGFNYSGGTVVQAGTLSLDASQSSSSGALTVNNAALTVALNNGTSSLNAGNLTFSGNSVLNLNFGSATSPTAYAINANGSTVSITGTNTINLTGQSLVIGQYPLIYTGSSVPTNHFKLGPMPTGVVAVLTNSGASLDLLITAAGQSLNWYGADGSGNALTNWDISTSADWTSIANSLLVKYLQYATNSYGDNVTFNDSCYLGQATNVNLVARVVPLTFTFNSSLPYNLTGAGGIDGPVSLTITNTGSLFLGTSNNFRGGTVISSTLVVTNDSALGTNTSGVTLLGGTLQFNGATTSARAIVADADSTLGVGAGAAVQFSGAITGSGGVALNIDPAGTLAFSGTAANSGGVTNVGGGVLNLTAANTVAASATVVSGAVELSNANAITNATLALQVDNGLIFNPGIGAFNVGGLSGANAVALADTGSSPVTLTVGVNNSSSTFSGTFTGAGVLAKAGTGTFTVYSANTHTGGTTVNGGTLAVADEVAELSLVTPFGTGPVTVNSGAVLELGSSPLNTFGEYDYANNITVNGGAIYEFDAFQHLQGTLAIGAGGATLGSTYDGPWDALYNGFAKGLFVDGLLTGTGNLTIQDSGLATGSSWNDSTVYLTSTASTAENTYSGTVTVVPDTADAGSYLYLIGTNVLANATVNLAGNNTASEGRMGVPTLLFGSGTSADGPGCSAIGGLTGSGNIVLADTLITTGGSAPVSYSYGTPVALAVGANNSSSTYSGVLSGAGSLTKVGTGTLILTGASTYTGNTAINGGTLELALPTLATNSTVAIASGAKLKLDFSNYDRVGALVLNGVSQPAGIYNAASTPAYLAGSGNVIVGAVATTPTGITVTAGSGTLTLAWPLDYVGWILQAQTNTLGAGLNTNWVDLPSSANDAAETITVSPNSPAVFYRLRYPN